MDRAETTEAGAPAVRQGFRRHVCAVCGHVEWIPIGQELPADYHCTMCGASAAVMLALDDPRLARHTITIEEVATGIYAVGKRPPFRADWMHLAYLLRHPDGLVLYDAPSLVTAEATGHIRSLGDPRLLVISHLDFVGLAGDWARVLGIPSWMGAADEPPAGNRFEPDARVDAAIALADDLELVPAPGHTPGSLALYWAGAPDGPALFAGDALALCCHPDGQTQLSFCQAPPVPSPTLDLARRPVHFLATCAGYLHDAQEPLRALCETEDRCARPYMDEPGGLWLTLPPERVGIPRRSAKGFRDDAARGT